MEIHVLNDGQFTSRGLVRLSVNCYLIRNLGINILIDTGIGNNSFYDADKYSVELPRRLSEQLNLFNISNSDIDYVINTHLHFDHSNGNFDSEGKASFANARYIIQKLEWDNMLSSGNKSRTRSFMRLQENNQVELLDGTTELPIGIKLISCGGHTDGFQYAVLKAEGQEHIFAGDIIPTVWHLNHENIENIDHDPLKLKKIKTEILEACLRNGSILYFQHSSAIKCSNIVKLSNKFRTQKISKS